MNPAPCFPLTGPRERDGLHERSTDAVSFRTGWGAGAMVRRRYFEGLENAYWMWCEGARKWRLCEPAGMFTAHAGDVP